MKTVSQLGVATMLTMRAGKVWAMYIVLRLLFFIVPFVLLVWLGTVVWMPIWLAAIVAALIGFSLSLLLLSTPRDRASTTLYDWRQRHRTQDEIEEDDLIEAHHSGSRAGSVAESAHSPNPQAAPQPEPEPEPRSERD